MHDPSRTLVTGFLGFGRFAENPSAALARACGRPHRLLEVRYDAVDAFLDSVDPDSFDALLMLGVAGGATGFRLERVARNRHGPVPDVAGHVPAVRTIDEGDDALTSTLWCDATVSACACDAVATSDDAGNYLCNYAFRRALRAWPAKRVGFLHVPPVEAIALDAQARTLATILDAIERRTSPPACRGTHDLPAPCASDLA